MKKITTLFERVYEGHKIVDILPNITIGCEEAFLHGIPTVKIDGTCCAIIGGVFYKRYDAKPGRKAPKGAIPCQEKADEITGHFPHWVKVEKNKPEDKWLYIAHYNREKPFDCDCTAEVYGKHFNGNPYGLDCDKIEKHGQRIITDLPDRTFEAVKQWLELHYEEGIVFWLNGVPVCKIKRSDFGFEWGGRK